MTNPPESNPSAKEGQALLASECHNLPPNAILCTNEAFPSDDEPEAVQVEVEVTPEAAKRNYKRYMGKLRLLATIHQATEPKAEAIRNAEAFVFRGRQWHCTKEIREQTQ
jgi:hypothetical protein